MIYVSTVFFFEGKKFSFKKFYAHPSNLSVLPWEKQKMDDDYPWGMATWRSGIFIV